MKSENAKKENRKALPLFLLICIVALFIGFGCGWFIAGHGAGLGARISNLLERLLRFITPWGTLLCAAIAAPICIWLLRSNRKMLAGWDGEDETVLARMETRTSFVLIISGLFLLASYFFLSSAYVYLQGLSILLVCGQVLAAMALSVFLQQKAVDFSKTLNPEKHGSIYDVRFHKKWMGSCDEAEQAQVYKASYVSMQAFTTACLILWLLLTLASFSFNYGLLPSAIVLLLWAIQQIAYFIACLKSGKSTLEKH